MTRVVIVGAAGRMGRAVAAVLATARDLELGASVDRESNHGAGGGVWLSRAEDAVKAGDVVIEFAGPEGAAEAARACAAVGAGLVSGSTGLSDAQSAEMSAASETSAVLRASNFSLGVLALRRAVRAALKGLPASWDLEIVERHHRGKLDSPSGTALTLIDDAKTVRGTPDAELRHGREGRAGPRIPGEIGVHAVRGGSWVGDHTVLLGGEGEALELRHVAQDRSAFAMGAVAAARFVATAAPGLYTLEHLAGDRAADM